MRSPARGSVKNVDDEDLRSPLSKSACHSVDNEDSGSEGEKCRRRSPLHSLRLPAALPAVLGRLPSRCVRRAEAHGPDEIEAGRQRSFASCACRCLSRLPVSRLLNGAWRRGNTADERVIHEFFEVMLGTLGTKVDGCTEVVQESRLCPEELTAELVLSLCLEEVLRTDGPGLARVLRPFLEDLLMRRQNLHAVVDLLAAAAVDEEDLPKVLLELTPKDLFVGLLLATPKIRWPRLSAAYVSLRTPLPILFRRPVSVNGELRTFAAFHLLHELACVPRAGRQLVLSLGTQRVAGCGKTELLGSLALTLVDKSSLDMRPAGPLHLASCDLSCSDADRWVADAHGHWSGMDDDFRSAILALMYWGHAVCIVHCHAGDFNAKTGTPGRELTDILVAVKNSSSVVQGANSPGGTAYGSRGCTHHGVIFLVRDVAPDVFALRQPLIEESLQEHCPRCLGLFAVEDYRNLRSVARRATATDELRSSIEERLASAWTTCTSTPSLEELNHMHALLAEGLRAAGRADICHSGGDAVSVTLPVHIAASDVLLLQKNTAMRRSALGEEFVALLNEAHRFGSAASTLFPRNALQRQITTLQRSESSLGVQSNSANPRGLLQRLSRLEQLRLEEDHANACDAEMQQLEAELSATPCSAVMKFFLRVIAAGNPTAITELSLYLEDWKESRVLPLLEMQRRLLDKTDIAGEAETHSHNIKQVARYIEELDFSVDSFWVELELLRQHTASQTGVKADNSQKCLEKLLREGNPFQVLHGRPLCMAGNFLRSVLEAIDAPASDPRGVYVVSVIGAQSSAKSTLLNFLFGCGFAVKAGRCTRGLYASYFRPAGGQPMLVLDSEGLLSLGSEGAVFDGQIALMCMTCSHLVLVNHKGELSRQLQDLLEVCLYAMRHLRLNRLQPQLLFVLRDQHDRSTAVHEEMLKKMRNHLEEAARKLGSSLEDLICIDGTAIFLLPSAVTSELRQGKEVCWTSELFAREVLRLRSEIFRRLSQEANCTAEGHHPEFGSLQQWYDHAATVWETLVQFGEQLLHYKTILEIEVRRQLADVAKCAVQDTLEGHVNSTLGHVNSTRGFHARAQQIVDSFAARIHANPTKLDLETIDIELCRALACLQDECADQLGELFQERTSDPRFTLTAKEQAKQQIRTPVDWAFENHLYTWKLHLKRASDEQAMHALWEHFTGVLNRHLASSGHRSTLSESESRSLFDCEWHAYEAQYLLRCKGLTKDRQTLAHEVTLLFNHAVANLQHESGTPALLKEIGPQQVAMLPEERCQMGMACLLDQSNEEWEDQYFSVGWWASVKKRSLTLLNNGSVEATSTGSTIAQGTPITSVRQLAQQGLQKFHAQVVEKAALDDATAVEGLRHICVVFQEIESRLLNDWSATLKRPQMLHALHYALRFSCVEALVAAEEDKGHNAVKDLLAQKEHVQEHFLLIVQTNKGDVEKAANFANMYHRSLSSWLDREVTGLAAEVRSQVLQEMPDPQKSSERAFQLSFAARNWPDVLEYVLDENAYLEKLFLTLFHQRKRAYAGAARSRLEKRLVATYRLLQELTNQWARGETCASQAVVADVGVTRGPASVADPRSVGSLKDFITAHAEHSAANSGKADSHWQLAECMPATADFGISDPRLFAEAFAARIGDFIESPELRQRLAEQLESSLREQSVGAWLLIKGCSERCPLCGSKCACVGEHDRHHCAHHLFPAFHGWMDRNTGLPSFNQCLSCGTREGTYECKDGVWRNFKEYLAADHPSWSPFIHDAEAGDRDVQHLRAAWVNCREPLLELFSPMADFCPEEWIEAHEEKDRALTKGDLQRAKDVIRRLRNHVWVPPDD